MNPEEIQQIRWFKSKPGSMLDSESLIDTDNGIIRDVLMVQEGPAEGHGVHLDSDFIDAITAFDKKYYTKIGLKGRFGHPNGSSETMGTQLGIFKNFRKRDKDGKMQTIADLHLLESANISPTHPGMRDWVLSMAGERPDFIMSSIVFYPSGYYQRDATGKKVAVWKYDDEGDWISANSAMPVYVEFDEKNGAKHLYTDLVEAGAATDNMFSNKVNTHLYAAQVDEFLSHHPHLIEFLKTNPDAVGRWLSRAGYSINTTQQKMSKFNLLAFLKGDQQSDGTMPTVDDLTEIKEAFNQARTEYDALRKERDDFKTKFEAASKQAEQLSNDSKVLRTDVEKLSADLKEFNARLEVVEKKPADEHTNGDGIKPLSVGKTKGKLWESFKEAHDIP